MLSARCESPKPVARSPGLLGRLRLPYLHRHYPARGVRALYMLINGFVTIGLLGVVAMLTKSPFIFPSLGPTAILLFTNPSHPASTPRSTLLGHTIGILCGYGSLWLLGLTHQHSALEGVEIPRIICAALALAGTGAFMLLLNVMHPPAGATTLIIALGIIRQPLHLMFIEISVALLVMQGCIINLVAGFAISGDTPEPRRVGAGKDTAGRECDVPGSTGVRNG